MRINSNLNNYTRINKNSDIITKKLKVDNSSSSTNITNSSQTNVSSLKEANALISETMKMIMGSSVSTESLFGNIDGSKITDLLA